MKIKASFRILLIFLTIVSIFMMIVVLSGLHPGEWFLTYDESGAPYYRYAPAYYSCSTPALFCPNN